MSKKITKKRVIIAVIILILVVGIIGVVNFYPILLMKPTATGVIEDTPIHAVKNNRNSLYFIKGDNGYILIDAGSDAKKIEQSLEEEQIDPAQVEHILLTHSDYDHVAGLGLFENADIYMSSEELQLIDGTTNRNGRGGNSLPEGISKEDLIYVEADETLLLDEREIQCMQAPGHTTGSMAYYVDGTYLFTGDAFMVSGGKVDVHPFTMDEATSKETIQMIQSTWKNSEVVFTAHYGYFEGAGLEIN